MKLSPRSITVVKLTLWAGILVWMVFFFAFGVIAAQRLGAAGPTLFGIGIWGQVLTWVAPIWVVFTALLVCIYVARFVTKKLRPKELEVTEQGELRTFVQQVKGIELTERDIKAVASSRYMRKRQWYLVGSLVGVMVLMIRIVIFVPQGDFLRFLVFVPLAGWLVYVALLFKGLLGYEKKLIEEWKVG